MIDIRITIDAAAALQALAHIDDDRLRAVIANAVADEVVLPALHKYPPASRKAMPMTAKQRRAFFAKLRAGEISVPYQRTGRYGRSFVKQPTGQGVDVTSSLIYAPYVRGPDQAAYHRGTWDDLETLAQELEGDAALAATAAVTKEIAGL